MGPIIQRTNAFDTLSAKININGMNNIWNVYVHHHQLTTADNVFTVADKKYGIIKMGANAVMAILIIMETGVKEFQKMIVRG